MNSSQSFSPTSCYSSHSTLFFGETVLSSAEGVQQGDILGPLLFCLAIHALVLRLKSEFRVFYLGDGTLGGTEGEVLKDFQLVEQEAALLGLHRNRHTTKLICGDLAGGLLLQLAPDLCKVDPKDAVLLGSPIGQSVSIDAAITSRVEALKFMGHRLTHFRKHDALILLRHSFVIPRILYILRTAPCFFSPCLESFD